MQAADVFYLSSREDPFPSVVLEALAAGLPVVGHEGCGGCDDLVREFGTLVARSAPQSVENALRHRLNMSQFERANEAERRRAEVATRFQFDDYVFALAERAVPSLRSVSVVVPNYNYERYIGRRLQSVFDQTYPVREVIVLDDASPDASVTAIRNSVDAAGRVIQLTVNEKNTGSPFAQWIRGVRASKGDYVWIAEADDDVDPEFLEQLIGTMTEHDATIGFVDSRQMDEDGVETASSYRPYINQIEPGAFDEPFVMDGRTFLARFLAVKNVILNVSGVIFHRERLLAAIDAVGDDLLQYQVAGDWRLYVELCRAPGSVVYSPQALNIHRRHKAGVTSSLKVDRHLEEIASIQAIARGAAPLSDQTLAAQAEHLSACRQHLMAT